MTRCKSCSAPLEGYKIKCDYCGVRNDIDLKGIHAYTTKTPESHRSCPRCDQKLQSIDLNIGGPFYIEQCAHCQGMFFDPDELKVLLDKTVHNVFSINYKQLDEIHQSATRRESIVQYIKCPECREYMNRINFGAKSGVVIDQCRKHGIWLDGGELKQLLEWKKLGGQLLEDQKNVDKAIAQKKEKERKTREHEQYIDQDRQGSGGDSTLFDITPSGHFGLVDLIYAIAGRIFR